MVVGPQMAQLVERNRLGPHHRLEMKGIATRKSSLLHPSPRLKAP